MKKKQVELKKLTLNKEKIAILTQAQLQNVVGGVKVLPVNQNTSQLPNGSCDSIIL